MNDIFLKELSYDILHQTEFGSPIYIDVISDKYFRDIFIYYMGLIIARIYTENEKDFE